MKKTFLLLIASIISIALFSQLTMPHMFSDHMVLQRETDIPVWGKAKPGTEVVLELAGNKTKTIADAYGDWSAKLPQLNAGGPYELIVFKDGNKKPSLVFSDVLIGDVWLASGQSNMEFQVYKADGADQEIPNAYNENIRFFNVPQNKTLKPQDNTKASNWQVCDSNTVKNTSAVAYYFAKKLVKENGVPIGLLESTWGGTPVEAWTSREMLLTNPGLNKKVLDNDSLTYEHFSWDSLDLITFWEIVYHVKNGMDTIIPNSDYDDSGWKSYPVPGVLRELESDFYEGMVWLRKTIELSGEFVGKELKINLGFPEMNYSVYFNGVEICKNQWNANKNHTYTIPSGVTKVGENILVVRFASLWGGGGLNPPADSIYLSNGKGKINLSGNWKYKKDLEPGIPEIHNYHQYPTFLFNAMINPIIPYGLKGIIWYQGEHNEPDAYNYRNLFPLLITDWRIRFEQGYLPFLFVQLPNYYKRDSVPADGKWAVLRESQAEALRLPNVGMACIIDLGMADNIHPTNKTDVGNRLADVAQKQVYGKSIITSNPIIESYKVDGDKIKITFTETANGLKTSSGKTIKGFAIAGEDQQFYWAKATINNNVIVVSSVHVKKPVAVRYAWANNPDCNLVNSEDQPAIPFRTDTWRVVTQEIK